MRAVCTDLQQRSALGIKKYGRPLHRATELTLRDWLQHQYEELLDAANYCKAAILHLDGVNPEDLP